MTTERPEGVDFLLLKKEVLKTPSFYQVLLLNDDFTPMDFVVSVLERFFYMDRLCATQIMFKIHHEGRGLCGIYPKDVAATKVGQVVHFARQNEHPLRCVMEENR